MISFLSALILVSHPSISLLYTFQIFFLFLLCFFMSLSLYTFHSSFLESPSPSSPENFCLSFKAWFKYHLRDKVFLNSLNRVTHVSVFLWDFAVVTPTTEFIRLCYNCLIFLVYLHYSLSRGIYGMYLPPISSTVLKQLYMNVCLMSK